MISRKLMVTMTMETGGFNDIQKTGGHYDLLQAEGPIDPTTRCSH